MARNAASASSQVCLFITILSLGSLGFALVLEHFFDVDPCILCTYQRVPYIVTAGFGLFGFAAPLPPPRRRTVVLFCVAAMVVGAGIATYQVGIEQAWWGASQGCTNENLGTLTMDDMQAALSQKPEARCDAVTFTLFGMSLPMLNLIASSIWIVLGSMLLAERRLWREQYFAPRKN